MVPVTDGPNVNVPVRNREAFFVHPALFWCFGRAQAEQAMAAADRDELAAE